MSNNPYQNVQLIQDPVFHFEPNLRAWYLILGITLSGTIFTYFSIFPQFAIIFLIFFLISLVPFIIATGKGLLISPEKIEFRGRYSSISILFSEISSIKYDDYGSDYRAKFILKTGKKITKDIKNWHVSVNMRSESYIKSIIERYWHNTQIRSEMNSPVLTIRPEINLQVPTQISEMNSRVKTIKPEMNTKIETIKPKICPICGATLGSGAAFCSQCGNRLEKKELD